MVGQLILKMNSYDLTVARDELSLVDGVLLWGSRVVVPPQARNTVLEEVHAAHIGTARMKSLTRQFVWWPKIDNDLESKIRSCNICQKFKGQLKWKIYFIFYNLDMLV